MEQEIFKCKPTGKYAVYLILLGIVSLAAFFVLLIAEKTMDGYEYKTIFFYIEATGRTIFLFFTAIMAVLFGFLAYKQKWDALKTVSVSSEEIVLKRTSRTVIIKVTDVRQIVSVNNRTRIEGFNVSKHKSVRIVTDNKSYEIDGRMFYSFDRLETALRNCVQPDN